MYNLLNIYDTDTVHLLNHQAKSKNHPKFYAFLGFKTDFLAKTSSGLERGHAGDFLITSPNMEIYHTNTPEASCGFINSWCHTDRDRTAPLIKKYQIPTDRILAISSLTFFDDFLKTVRAETLSAQPFCQERIYNAFEAMMIELARQICLSGTEKKQHFQELRTVRNKMLQDPRENYSLEELAREASLSPSRFSHLYREYFGISPIEELTRARLQEAEKLLLTTNMSIEAIAVSCGYSNVFHFSRIFKTKVQCSPSKYRKG